MAPGRVLRRWSCPPALRRTGLAALIVVLAAAVVHAERPFQDWLPEVIRMPGDAEILSESEIGSTVRMFSVSTSENTSELFVEWQEALREVGYSIVQEPGEFGSRVLEFSGEGVANAKIAESPARTDGRAVIQFDATLP